MRVLPAYCGAKLALLFTQRLRKLRAVYWLTTRLR